MEEFQKCGALFSKIFRDVSGINGIIEGNIEFVCTYIESYCWKCRNTENGNLFIKIESGEEAHYSYKDEIKRLQFVYGLVEEYPFIPKIVSFHIIPNKKYIPTVLHGKMITFFEILNYYDNDISYDDKLKEYFFKIGKFHSFFKDRIQSKNPKELCHYLFASWDFQYIKTKLYQNYIDIEQQNYNLFFSSISIKTEKLIKKSFNNMGIHNECDIISLWKELFLNIFFKNKVSCPNLYIESIDDGKINNYLHNILHDVKHKIFSKNDYKNVKELCYLSSYFNILKHKNELVNIFETINNMRAIIYKIQKLPRTLVHNDAHGGNFIYTENGLFLIDFSKMGINSKIADFRYFIGPREKDSTDTIIKSIFNGYLDSGQEITEEEIVSLYDIDVLYRISDFVMNIDMLNNGLYDRIFSTKLLFEFIKNLRNEDTQIMNSERINRILNILSDVKKERRERF